MQEMTKLLDIADTLLGDGGCPWDKKQTLENLQRYLIEEAYEAVEAIDEKDFVKIKEEIGDLMYTIVFIVKLAEKKGKFTFAEALDNLSEKLIRRHPHIFGEKRKLTPDQVLAEWMEIKKSEKKQKHPLAGIPEKLPLLMRAQLVVRRLKKSGIALPEDQNLKAELEELEKSKKMSEKDLVSKLLTLIAAAEKNDFSLEDSLRRELKAVKKKVLEENS